MPPIDISLECYSQTFESVHRHFEQKTLERGLPSVRVPAIFVLGAGSPIPPEHGVASAALIPGAQYQIEEDCGHFIWIERPGSVLQALADISLTADAVQPAQQERAVPAPAD
jgi:pimeloyl-ACP methyl ester carboxylesterase